MRRTSTSLELSEYFNNDDSQGHRLLKFFQKKRGGVQRQNFIFMNCEPQRLSLNVQLEKLENKNKENEKDNNKNEEKETNNATQLSGNQKNEQQCKASDVLSSEMNAKKCIEVPEGVNESLLPFIPASPISSGEPVKILHPGRISPLNSSIRKSGGRFASSDMLRRSSLKRLTKLCVGRRTLLEEFESTIGDTKFEPPVCSTPLVQPESKKALSSINSCQPPESECIEPNFEAKSASINELSCCGRNDTLIRTLQRKDEELKTYMENILDNKLKQVQQNLKKQNKSKIDETISNTSLHTIKSPLKSTYTVDKGDIPGQVILTPDKNGTKQSSRISRLLHPQTQFSPSNLLQTSQHLDKSVSGQHNTSNCRNSYRGSLTDQQLKTSSENLKDACPAISNTPSNKNISIVYPSQNTEIPVMQDHNGRECSIVIAVGEMPLIVVPVNQNVNRTNDQQNNSTEKLKHEQVKNNSRTLLAQGAETNKVLCEQLLEDNLKLSDILTEDEYENPKVPDSQSLQNNSHAPLNLASRVTKLRIKRLRKRSASRRRLHIENSPQLTTETDAEFPPQSYCTSRTTKRKHIPLNRAPGVPLNGENFAQELARMSNYEILDLRKRNSMGKVFAISGRKSGRFQEEVVKKQHQLNEQIENELVKRNMGEITEKMTEKSDKENLKDDKVHDYVPVPTEFRNSFKIQNDSKESLINEKSSDRISFKNKENTMQSAKVDKNNIPEVLKQYLNIPKIISEKKKRKSFDKSKRSLYTQGYSDTSNDDIDNSAREGINRSSSRIKNRSMQCVPSPPKSNGDLISSLKVVSPPPPLSITPRKSNTQQQQHIDNSCDITAVVVDDVGLAPPPPGFESDSGVSSHNFNHSTINRSTQTAEFVNKNTTYLNTKLKADNNEDLIFKKPEHPAPKIKGRKRQTQKDDKTPSSDLQQFTTDSQHSTDTSTDKIVGTLRRSKRGQVPSSCSLFQILFQQSLDKRLQDIEKKKLKEKQKKREITRNLERSGDISPVKLMLSQKSTITKKRDRKQKQLPTVQESDSFINTLRTDAEILNKKNIKDSKVIRKPNKKRKEKTVLKENVESSRLILHSPLPVDHLNNVFDQLRDTSLAHDMTPLVAAPPQIRVKPCKVRVARLKPSIQSNESDIVSTTSSTSNKNSNYELISWLKNITEADTSSTCSGEIFKEMRISAASNLSFTELQGVEYAFYDTEDKASLGYLRFKPYQIKPKKKAKRFHLHFIALAGNFRITANEKESLIGVGDMVAIEKSVYYDIKNLSDDIGILMVIKK